jgi:hypothetical protein
MSMTHYLTEADLRAGEYRHLTQGINTAFLLEIKQDHVEFRVLFQRVMDLIGATEPVKPREFAELLGSLRDEIETYFSLEEFYGGFDMAFQADPMHARTVAKLKHQHEQLFTYLNDLVERAEQIVYHEVPHPHSRLRDLIADVEKFAVEFRRHEDRELDLITEQSSLDVGVGD